MYYTQVYSNEYQISHPAETTRVLSQRRFVGWSFVNGGGCIQCVRWAPIVRTGPFTVSQNKTYKSAHPKTRDASQMVEDGSLVQVHQLLIAQGVPDCGEHRRPHAVTHVSRLISSGMQQSVTSNGPSLGKPRKFNMFKHSFQHCQALKEDSCWSRSAAVLVARGLLHIYITTPQQI